MPMGGVKSAVGIGTLLAEGIGDTIRVSLTDDPVEEVKVGTAILQSLGLRKRGLDLVACPSCGRAEVDVLGPDEAGERGARAGGTEGADPRRGDGMRRERAGGGAGGGSGHRRRQGPGVPRREGRGDRQDPGDPSSSSRLVAEAKKMAAARPPTPTEAVAPALRPPTSRGPQAADIRDVKRDPRVLGRRGVPSCCSAVPPMPAGAADVPGTACSVFPDDNVWNMDIREAPDPPAERPVEARRRTRGRPVCTRTSALPPTGSRSTSCRRRIRRSRSTSSTTTRAIPVRTRSAATSRSRAAPIGTRS